MEECAWRLHWRCAEGARRCDRDARERGCTESVVGMDCTRKGCTESTAGRAAGMQRKRGCTESAAGSVRGMHGKRGARRAHGRCTGKGCTESAERNAVGHRQGRPGLAGDAGGAPEVREGCRGVHGSRAPFTSSGSAGSPLGAARRSARSLPPAEQGRLRGGGSRPAPHIAPPACSAAAPGGKPAPHGHKYPPTAAKGLGSVCWRGGGGLNSAGQNVLR